MSFNDITCLFCYYLIASVPKGTYSLCLDRKRPTGKCCTDLGILSILHVIRISLQRKSSTGKDNLFLSVLDVRVGVVC